MKSKKEIVLVYTDQRDPDDVLLINERSDRHFRDDWKEVLETIKVKHPEGCTTEEIIPGLKKLGWKIEVLDFFKHTVWLE